MVFFKIGYNKIDIIRRTAASALWLNVGLIMADLLLFEMIKIFGLL